MIVINQNTETNNPFNVNFKESPILEKYTLLDPFIKYGKKIKYNDQEIITNSNNIKKFLESLNLLAIKKLKI